MNKNEIVQYALPPRSKRDEAQVLATESTTADAIEAKVAQAKKEAERQAVRVARWDKVQAISTGIGVLTFLVAVGLCLYESTIAISLTSWKIVLISMLMSGATVFFSAQFQRLHEHNERICLFLLNQLEPIAGTNDCQEALRYLESDAPGVASWRDIAIAERGQLYKFDVRIMRQLHILEKLRLNAERDREERKRQAEAAAISQVERQRLSAEACRKVHGLVPLSDNG